MTRNKTNFDRKIDLSKKWKELLNIDRNWMFKCIYFSFFFTKKRPFYFAFECLYNFVYASFFVDTLMKCVFLTQFSICFFSFYFFSLFQINKKRVHKHISKEPQLKSYVRYSWNTLHSRKMANVLWLQRILYADIWGYSQKKIIIR